VTLGPEVGVRIPEVPLVPWGFVSLLTVSRSLIAFRLVGDLMWREDSYGEDSLAAILVIGHSQCNRSCLV